MSSEYRVIVELKDVGSIHVVGAWQGVQNDRHVMNVINGYSNVMEADSGIIGMYADSGNSETEVWVIYPRDRVISVGVETR